MFIVAPLHNSIVHLITNLNNLIFFFSRGYSTKKLQSNVQCEIFQTLFEEAMESYDNNIVHELRNETFADMERNITHISTWITKWIEDNVKK